MQIQVRGRCLKEPLGLARAVEDGIHVRFEDDANPEFWAETTIPYATIASLMREEPEYKPLDRDRLGRVVRQAWIAWAREQPDPKPSHLVPYDDLNETDKEADRVIGEMVAAYTIMATFKIP